MSPPVNGAPALEVDVRVARGAFELHAVASAPVPGVTALFGRSGAGKSTLANALAGLVPARGRVRLGAACWLDDATRTQVPAERRRIGYVFQDARLFPHYDVLGNLRYGARRAREVRAYAAFDEIVALLGLERLLAQRPHELSGGERQRVALGRALLSQPQLLILDEPLASLDVARREEVLPYLERLRDRYAVPMLYVSHQYDEVLRLATHVWLLDGGRVVASGTPAATSLDPRLRAIVGPEAVGAVVEARVEDDGDGREGDRAHGQEETAASTGRLAVVRVGDSRLRLALAGIPPGPRVRLQILARDVILATEAPRGLSVRNELRGEIEALADDGADGVLVTVRCGDARVLARVTREACAALRLRAGTSVWALVKAASLRGHVFHAP